jgi:hypothetical protein
MVAPRGKEALVEAFPFLLVYRDGSGKRVEEYFIVGRAGPGERPRATLQSPASVNMLRATLGYAALR